MFMYYHIESSVAPQIMQELLVLLVLFFLYNHLKNPPDPPVEVEQLLSTGGQVYITNRYFQRVIRTHQDGKLQVAERVGGRHIKIFSLKRKTLRFERGKVDFNK